MTTFRWKENIGSDGSYSKWSLPDVEVQGESLSRMTQRDKITGHRVDSDADCTPTDARRISKRQAAGGRARDPQCLIAIILPIICKTMTWHHMFHQDLLHYITASFTYIVDILRAKQIAAED
ncbi:hypothetical protein RvY_13425 [Ramazzottius varieornatus]|uniref:Uncharacterized protein n=1 Tax=Ramazzottius varieornatus TaxID=947166 RepID=A0A1D1VRV8_RAMVA|nr:hypothetical protein RvY_13425 [Ramazzottius varieornatus]